MRFRRPLLAQVLLFVGLLGAFGFERYRYALHFQEIAGVCVLMLFVWLALSTKVKRGKSWIIYVPALLIAVLVFLYAYVFYMRTGASLMPSILAQRERVFFLLAPVVYMLHIRGWRLADFERIFVFAALLAVADFAAAYVTVDAKSWYNSSDFYKRSMVTFDEWRGYRLKGPKFIAVLVALYFGRKALQARTLSSFVLAIVVTAVPVVLLILTFSRSTVLAALLALTIYGLFLWRAGNLSPSLIVLATLVPIVIFVLPTLASAFAITFAQDWSYTVRVEEVEKAWDTFLEYPLLGLGEASEHSVSFRDIFGTKFSPTDIGLLGVALQYGIVGLLLYLFFGLWIFVSFLKLLMKYRGQIEPRQSAFLWILLTMCFAYLIVSPLQRPFIEIPDLAVVAFSWGLLMAHKHGLRGGLGVNRTGLQSPTPLHPRAKPVAYSGQSRPRR